MFIKKRKRENESLENEKLKNWVDAEIVERTFVVSHFLDILLGYDFVPSRIQKKRQRRDPHLVSYLPGPTRNKIITG